MSEPFRIPSEPGFPLVVSGPSGVGKTVLCQELLAELPWTVRSVSATTRPRREDEIEGESYFFYTEAHFASERDRGGMAEWAEVHGRLYGTPRAFLDSHLANRQVVVLNIDVQGGLAIRRAYAESVLVFVAPPSLEVLEARLRGRQTDSDEAIARRLGRAEGEMGVISEYDYLLVNDDLAATADALMGIARAERARVSRRYERAGDPAGPSRRTQKGGAR